MLHIVFPRILSPKMHEKNIAPVIVCIPFHLTDCLQRYACSFSDCVATKYIEVKHESS